MSNEDSYVIGAMKIYGGSFVKKLADLASSADPENLKLIKKTWAGYWEIYSSKLEK